MNNTLTNYHNQHDSADLLEGPLLKSVEDPHFWTLTARKPDKI